ncbi:unnamed protein product [Effrenium voratum]|uniref:Uncharacterized protein n=1 Tax=Effrenium voratum TaxID=2562239 RepID=A0AA36J9P4_9DINO|nr:unnamed protein product [Effrenium voratum]CAJ1444556.1 unnamed protein product [Effrenium voratum]
MSRPGIAWPATVRPKAFAAPAPEEVRQEPTATRVVQNGEDPARLESWVIAWAEKMCQALEGEASQPSSARNPVSVRGSQARARPKAKVKCERPRVALPRERIAAVSALNKLERVLQPFLSVEDFYSPRQSASTPRGTGFVVGKPGGQRYAPAARAGSKGAVEPAGAGAVRHAFSRTQTVGAPCVQKVASGPSCKPQGVRSAGSDVSGPRPTARFTEVLGPRVYSDCSLQGPSRTALSAIMSSPRSSLMTDMLSRSSPQVSREGYVADVGPRLGREEALHLRLDRMQDLLSQAQSHTAEQLRLLRADYKELERIREEDPNREPGSELSSSDED